MTLWIDDLCHCCDAGRAVICEPVRGASMEGMLRVSAVTRFRNRGGLFTLCRTGIGVRKRGGQRKGYHVRGSEPPRSRHIGTK